MVVCISNFIAKLILKTSYKMIKKKIPQTMYEQNKFSIILLGISLINL